MSLWDIRIPHEYEPTKERLVEEAAMKPVRPIFTVDAHGLLEDGPGFFCYPDFELRTSDLRMRVTFPDGITRGEMLFYLKKLLDTARDDDGWNEVTRWPVPRSSTGVSSGGSDVNGGA